MNHLRKLTPQFRCDAYPLQPSSGFIVDFKASLRYHRINRARQSIQCNGCMRVSLWAVNKTPHATVANPEKSITQQITETEIVFIRCYTLQITMYASNAQSPYPFISHWLLTFFDILFHIILFTCYYETSY